MPGAYLIMSTPFMKKYGLKRHWGSPDYKKNLEAQIKRIQEEGAEGCLPELYAQALLELQNSLLGARSPVVAAKDSLSQHLQQAQIHLERLTTRLGQVEQTLGSERTAILSAARDAQAARIAVLNNALQELTARENKAHAFLAECRALTTELTGVAGDQALLRTIQREHALDEGLISAANQAGAELTDRLAQAFGNLKQELDEGAIATYTESLSSLPVEQLLATAEESARPRARKA